MSRLLFAVLASWISLFPAVAQIPRLPVWFEPLGQASHTFVLRGAGYAAYVQAAGLHLAPPAGSGHPAAFTLIGADRRARGHGAAALPSYSNYLRGNDPALWRTKVPHYHRVEFARIYPGIDVSYYLVDDTLEFDFLLEPGADPAQIRLSFSEPRQMLLSQSGDLLVDGASNRVLLRRPTCYQPFATEKQPVACSFVVRENLVTIRLGPYDSSRPLVIDPAVDYITRIGGSSLDRPIDIAVGPDGSVVVVGLTESTDFYTSRALQGESHSMQPFDEDLFVFKLSSDGREVLFSTYFGGSGEDRVGEVTLDSEGNIYFMGSTKSSDYPTTQNVIKPAKDTPPSVAEGFVTKLSADGSSILLSTFLGKMSERTVLFDRRNEGVALDAARNIFVAAAVTGPDLYDYPWFPTPKRRFHLPVTFHTDIVVMKLDPLASRVLYATYLGSRGDEFVRGMAVDGAGNLYLAGMTTSEDFPVQGAFGAQQGQLSTNAGVVVKLSPSGDLLASSYLAKPDRVKFPTVIEALVLDEAGSVYLTGHTQDPDFPLQNPLQTEGPGFVTKLNNSLSTIIYSTRIYGSPLDIAVDSTGRILLTGGNLAVFRTASNAFSEGGGTASLALIDASGQSFLYATSLGHFNKDPANLAVDRAGNALIAGLADIDQWATPLEIETIPYSFSPPNQPFRRMPALFVARISPQNAEPIIDAISPAIFSVGEPTFPSPPHNTVTLHGRGFVTGSTVDVADRPRSGKVDFKKIEFTVDKTDFSSARQVPVRLSAPPPGGVSAPRTLLVLNPTPAIRELWPPGAVKQAGAQELAIVGSGFTPGAKVRFGSIELIPRVLSELELELTLPAGSLVAPGLVPVTVSLPAPGGGASPPMMFLISNAGPAPAQRLAGVNPAYAAAGAASSTTGVYGTGFDESCSLLVNGQKRPTKFVNLETMTAQLMKQDLAGPGTLDLSVACESTGNVPTGPVPFAVSLDIGARDIVFDRARGRLYATIGPEARSGNSIAIINPETRKVEEHIPVGAEPRELAITDNHRYLYVGVDGESAIKRIDLASRSIAGVISLGVHESLGAYRAIDIEAQPGSDDTFIAIRLAGEHDPDGDITVYRGSELVATGSREGRTLDELVFADPRTVYGILSDQLNEWRFEANSLDLVRTSRGLPNLRGISEIFQWNNVLFLRGGVLVDRSSLTYKGRLPNTDGSSVAIVSSGRILSHSQIPGPAGYFLSIYDPQDFHKLAVTQTVSVSAAKIVQWSSRGLIAFDSGNIFFLDAPVPLRGPWFTRDSVTNSASYRAGPVASGEFLSIFGTDLSEGVHAAPDQNLPDELGGTKIRITDSAGQSKYARLHLSSPTQINLVVPEGLVLGPAELALERAGLPRHTIVLQVAPAAPGLFGFKTAAEDVAAAEVARLENGELTFYPVFRCSGAGACEPEPFSLGTGAILVLFATGFGPSPNDVRVEIGGLPGEILYAGPQRQYPGLDQINVRVPPELAGRGKVAIKAILGGQETNVVTVLVM